MPRPISLARFFCVLATAAATLASSTPSGEHPDSIATRIDANVTMTTMDVYYINLARRPDRKAHMLRELARHGVTRDHGFIVKRSNAVDGKADGFLSSSSSYSSYSSRGERKGGGRESEDGGADNVDRDRALFTAFDAAGLGAKPNANVLKANSLSHLGVWREVVASGVAYAVVLQDDAQLTEGFRAGLARVVRHNPAGAYVTWIGLNGYASGSVSRSATMKPGYYDPDYFSRELPGTNGVLGTCRPGLIATGSLAYLLTRKGALALVDRFGTLPPPPPPAANGGRGAEQKYGHDNDDENHRHSDSHHSHHSQSQSRVYGWEHHTDHAIVGYLDGLGLSFVSRTVLATTHDDGLLGSDIFEPSTAEAEALGQATRLVMLSLKFAKLPLKEAVTAAATAAANTTAATGANAADAAAADAAAAAAAAVALEDEGNTSMEGQQQKRHQQHHRKQRVEVGQEKDVEGGTEDTEDTAPWLRGVRVRCEETACYEKGCAAPRQVSVYLTWEGDDDGWDDGSDDDDDDDVGRGAGSDSGKEKCSEGGGAELEDEENSASSSDTHRSATTSSVDVVVDDDDASNVTVDDDANDDDDGTVVDARGIRRLSGRRVVVVPEAADKVTPLMVASSLPAWWTLEAWSVVGRSVSSSSSSSVSSSRPSSSSSSSSSSLMSRRHCNRRKSNSSSRNSRTTEEDRQGEALRLRSAAAAITPETLAAAKKVPHHPRPRFGIGDVVECAFDSGSGGGGGGGGGSIGNFRRWERAVVAAVGFRAESWPLGVMATYVVQHHDGRLLTVQVDDPDYVRAAAAATAGGAPTSLSTHEAAGGSAEDEEGSTGFV